MEHLGEQFAGLLRRVNDTFPVEYGDRPSMAKIGGLHVPVSLGQLWPESDSMTLHVPHENGSFFEVNLHPGTGEFSARTDDGNLFSGHDYDTDNPENFAELYHDSPPPADQDWIDGNGGVMRAYSRWSGGGRYIGGAGKSGDGPGRLGGRYQFDPLSGQVHGPFGWD